MKALYLALAITALGVGQPANGPIAGSWTATFEGRTFIRLELKTVNGAITGGMRLGKNLEIDSHGMVKRADAAPPDLKHIFGATRKGATVTFFLKDGNDTDQFELRVLENGDADLYFLLNDEDRKDLAAEGVPLPKPIRLTKAITPDFRADWAAILPADYFPSNMYAWCSRAAPARTGYWAPHAETIGGLEVALAPALQRALEREIKDPSRRPATNEYYRRVP